MKQTVDHIDIGSMASAISGVVSPATFSQSYDSLVDRLRIKGFQTSGSENDVVPPVTFGQAYANLVDRLRIRGFQTSYVGSEDEEVDYFAAGQHGTARLKWRTFVVQEDGCRVEQLYPEPLPAEIVEESFAPLDDYLRKEAMTLLVPDRERENQEDFIWCVPIERVKWNKWFDLSKKFKCVTPSEHGNVRYMNRMEGKEVRTILMMPTEEQSDDDAMHACAFLRLVKGLTCRIYVVRASDEQLSPAQMIHRYAGTDYKLVEDLDDSELPDADKTDAKP